jgi:hypothetical protein
MERRPGRRAYLSLLATEPGFAIRSVWGAWAEMVGAPDIGLYGDPAAIRRAHADQPKVHTVPLYDAFGSHRGPGRLIARAASRLTFAGLIAPVEPRSGRLLSLVPPAVLAVVLVAGPALGVAPGMVLSALFFAAVMVAQLPIALVATDSTTRLALLASISLSYLALCLLMLGPSAFVRGPGPRCAESAAVPSLSALRPTSNWPASPGLPILERAPRAPRSFS